MTSPIYPELGYSLIGHMFLSMNVEKNKAIGQCLRKLRTNHHLTQTQLALRLGTPQSYVSKIEMGERSLHVYELFPYSAALDEKPELVLSQIMHCLDSQDE